MDAMSARLNAVFESFGVDAVITNYVVGPATTRYDVTLGAGTRAEHVTTLYKTIQVAVGTDHVRLLTPIPGKSAVGIEVPNLTRTFVPLHSVDTAHYGHPLTVPIGRTASNEHLSANLGALPHLLVAGTTGSGKSSFLNSMLCTLIRRTGPEVVRLVLIDPKMVEFAPYADVPHLYTPVITEHRTAARVLSDLGAEMTQRYELLKDNQVRGIEAYNAKVDAGVVTEEALPYIVVVVDELADLLMANRKVLEPLIVALAQKGRAAGIHLVLATQRPSADVLTPLIKANAPSRLAFEVTGHTNSCVILDRTGAQNLLGQGDGLYLPVGEQSATRVQAPYVSDGDIDALVRWTQRQYPGVAPVLTYDAPQDAVPDTPTTPASTVPTHRPQQRQRATRPEPEPEARWTLPGRRWHWLAGLVAVGVIIGALFGQSMQSSPTTPPPPDASYYTTIAGVPTG